jgi:hypothetical protein
MLLREVRWTEETFQLAQLQRPTPDQLRAFFSKAHVERLRQDHRVDVPESRQPRPGTVTPELLEGLLLQNLHLGLSDQGKVHLLLAVAAMPRLDQVYQVVFERILNEKISTNPVVRAGR